MGQQPPNKQDCTTGDRSTELAALIARLGAVSAPDRVLDYDIAMCLNRPFGAWDSFQKYDAAFPTYTRRDAPRFTSSIDAALTLVPEGHHWHLHVLNDRPHCAGVCPDGEGCGDYFNGATPAIALCIAALKARMATDTAERLGSASGDR